MAFSMAPSEPLSYGRHDQQHGVGHTETGQLAQRGRGPVILDHERLEQGRRRPTGADIAHFRTHVVDGLVHFLPDVLENQTGQIVVH